jgi:hypothetical protein
MMREYFNNAGLIAYKEEELILVVDAIRLIPLAPAARNVVTVAV